MSTPLHAFITGTFVSAGAVVNLNLPSDVQRFSLYNLTSLGIGGATTPVMRAEWVLSMPDGAAIIGTKANGSDAINETSIATNGFIRIADSGVQTPGPQLAQTATTNANPIVVSAVNTGNLAVGDIVRIINNTGAQQITNFDWTVTAVTPNTSFTLGYTGVAPGSAGTGGFFRRIPFDSMYYPRRRFITNITAATSAVITMSVTHGFTVGQLVKIIVPAAWGMTQINNLYATITAINTTTNTITVNIDSSGFTAFAYPTSVIAAGGVNLPQVVPVGEAAVNTLAQPFANLLDDATRNTSFRGISIGTSVQTSGQTYRWIAERGVEL
jgi:hypothetical protein